MANRKKPSRAKNSSKKSNSKKEASKKSQANKRGGATFWLVLALVVVAVGIVFALQLMAVYKEEILQGVSIDGIDVSGMNEAEAKTVVQSSADEKLKNISIVFRYKDKQWEFNAEDLQAQINVDDSVTLAYETGKSGSVIERLKVFNQAKREGVTIKSSFVVDRQVLVDALADVKDEIDQPMQEATIEFDPEGYDFFEDMANPDVDMSLDMFTITEGKIGYDMDYDKAIQDLNSQLESGWNADVTLSVVETHPTVTAEMLKESTVLVFHSSSALGSNRTNTNRNHNIGKALGFYRGLVVMPGETVSYNELLGERTLQAGWLEAPTIGRDKTLVDELGGGICQAASTIFNAAFAAGAKIIESNPHSWPAYYDYFGYGMDAMINYGTSDLIFQNDSDYPMFFNAYFWYSSSTGLPGYVDVDVYTKPQQDENGETLHIMADPTEIRRETPKPTIYEPIDAVTAAQKYPDAEWTYDPVLKMNVYEAVTPRDLIEYSVDRVWYKDCEETDTMGVWTGGVEVKREYSHTYLYKSVTGKILTMPTPAPTPVATPSPTPAPSESAVG